VARSDCDADDADEDDDDDFDSMGGATGVVDD